MSFIVDATATFAIPAPVAEVLQSRQAGVPLPAGVCSSNGYCWVVGPDHLYVWRYEEARDARIRALRLPFAIVQRQRPQLWASVLPHASGETTVLLCTADGTLACWLDASCLAEATTTTICPAASAVHLTAFTAAAIDLGNGGTPAFAAAAAAADGSWFFIQGGAGGTGSRRLNVSVAPGSSSSGVLGMLGSVVSRTYTDAFDPIRKFMRKTPSRRPAVGAAVSVTAGGQLRVLLLTDQTLDCWLVGLGMRPGSEQLSWSYQTATAFQAAARVQDAANLAFDVCGDDAMLVALGRPDEYHVCRLQISSEGCPEFKYHEQLLGYKPRVAPHCTWSLSADFEHDAALLLCAADHSLVQITRAAAGSVTATHGATATAAAASAKSCTASGMTLQTLSTDTDTLAAGVVVRHERPAAAAATAAAPLAAHGVASWVVMNATYGVVELPTGARVEERAVPLLAGPMTLEHEQQVFQLLDSVLAQLGAQQQAAHATGAQLLGIAMSLQRRLDALGVYSPVSNSAVLAKYSSQLLDLLPKQWAAGGAGGTTVAAGGSSGSGGVSLYDQLQDKMRKHELLLQALAEGGNAARLTPPVLRVLLENAERLAVVSSILPVHARVQEEERPSASSSSSGPSILVRIVNRAGELSSSATSHEVLRPTEVFYARPSVSMGQLLVALREAAAELEQQADGGFVAPGAEGAEELQRQVYEAGLLVATVGQAAHARRDAAALSGLRVALPEMCRRLGEPDWLSGRAARAAYEALAKASLAVRKQLGDSAAALEAARSLYGITDVLLNACAAAVGVTSSSAASATAAAAAAGRDATQAGRPDSSASETSASGSGAQVEAAAAVREYRTARDVFVSALLEDGLMELRGVAGGSGSGRGVGLPADHSWLLIGLLETMCCAHHCYPQLFDVCEALAAADPARYGGRLHMRMQSMVTPSEEGSSGGTFSAYVMQRLLDDERPADLLSVPPVFYPQLQAFLALHPKLLWLHELRTSQFGPAASTLLMDAAGERDTFPKHRRLASLAKLSARAAQLPGPLANAEELLYLSDVQIGLGLHDRPALGPVALAGAALGTQAGGVGTPVGTAPVAPVSAVAALAGCAPDELERNRTVWQLSWQRCLEVTDWAQLDASQDPATGGAEGALRATPLYQAAAACCGRSAFGVGAGGVDTRPVAEVVAWLRQWTSSDARVQALVVHAFELALHDYGRSVTAAAASAADVSSAMEM